MSYEIIRPARNIWSAMRHGAVHRCPSCGRGRLYGSFLKVVDHCPACGEDLYHHRADDAPPYLTIFLVGHIVVPLLLLVERAWHPELWIHFSLWIPMIIILSLLLLPVLKGVVVGLQWALYMHGFELGAVIEAEKADA